MILEIICIFAEILQSDMDSDFVIIQALCRSALSSSREMTEHQMGRLIDCYKKSGKEKEAKSLEESYFKMKWRKMCHCSTTLYKVL